MYMFQIVYICWNDCELLQNKKTKMLSALLYAYFAILIRASSQQQKCFSQRYIFVTLRICEFLKTFISFYYVS